MKLLKKLKAIKKIIRKCFRNIKKLKNMNKDILYLSFGENCLTDNILARFNIKSFSTPYSSGRSNIEYILQLEKNNFKDFLNPTYMYYDYVENDKVVRLSKYKHIENKYADLHMNGFEFTHHDVLGDSKQRETFERRTKRLLSINNKKICIFYHNRYNEGTNEDILIEHLTDLKNLYQTRGAKVYVFMFTQVIINNDSERKVEHKNKNHINIYKFYTKNPWAGTDQDIFWARCDDDLIKIMIDDAKSMKF